MGGCIDSMMNPPPKAPPYTRINSDDSEEEHIVVRFYKEEPTWDDIDGEEMLCYYVGV